MDFNLMTPNCQIAALVFATEFFFLLQYMFDLIFSFVFHSVMAVPATVIYFTCYDQLFSLLRFRMGDYADKAPALAGALARGEQAVRVTNNYNDCTGTDNADASNPSFLSRRNRCVWVVHLFVCCVRFSRVGVSHQSSGADPNKAAGRETVVQATDRMHPLRRADRRLAFSLARIWTDAFARRALLSHVLVQLREGQSLAVWAIQYKRANIRHYLHFRSSFRLCKCLLCSFETKDVIKCDGMKWICISPFLSDCINCYVAIRCCQNKKAGWTGRAGCKEM